MKTRIILISLAIMTLNAVVGCTFRSNQLNALLSLLPSKSQGPVATWYLSSTKIYEEVYPINVEDEVWFANEEGLFIRFDGWNITEVKNVGLGLNDIKIDSTSLEKTYAFGNEMEVLASCAEWMRSLDSNAALTVYEESCFLSEQDIVNRITVNSQGSIVELRFMLHPEHEYFYLRPM